MRLRPRKLKMHMYPDFILDPHPHSSWTLSVSICHGNFNPEILQSDHFQEFKLIPSQISLCIAEINTFKNL